MVERAVWRLAYGRPDEMEAQERRDDFLIEFLHEVRDPMKRDVKPISSYSEEKSAAESEPIRPGSQTEFFADGEEYVMLDEEWR
jgi:hypothetical protein